MAFTRGEIYRLLPRLSASALKIDVLDSRSVAPSSPHLEVDKNDGVAKLKDTQMNYQPLTIGNRFRIQPPGCSAPDDGRIALIMRRGAFGSGEHETTASCLEILEQLDDLVGARVLDFGSGTGILSIAALRLGAAHTVCLDIDPRAVQTARDNTDLNGLLAQTTHTTTPLDQLTASDFDLILANIYADILLACAAELINRTRPGGQLLLSGIPWEENYSVRQTYERLGCTVLKNRLLAEYSTVLLRKS
ncbi:MAG: 50S ribosomal protein L11 methyltransferase [Desulfuromonadales bacterium]|nr:50S ribosomal protein L11 methyltransferase [Desulfuromonadales bacterium]